jgi:hypothetical protein
LLVYVNAIACSQKNKFLEDTTHKPQCDLKKKKKKSLRQDKVISYYLNPEKPQVKKVSWRRMEIRNRCKKHSVFNELNRAFSKVQTAKKT